jgi:hypothetical protein
LLPPKGQQRLIDAEHGVRGAEVGCMPSSMSDWSASMMDGAGSHNRT